MIIIKIKILKNSILIMMSLSILALMYIYPTIIKSSVINSLSNCYNILIPSIFPYITATRVLSEYIIKYISISENKLINRSKVICAIAVLIGLISGFPNGAIIAGRLYEIKIISKRDAERIVALSNCISPSFCIIYFGKFVLNNMICGILIFLSIVLSNLLISLIFKNNNEHIISPDNKSLAFLSFPQIIADCCHIMLDICAFVTFFTCLGNVLIRVISLKFSIAPDITAVIISLLEITTGVMNFVNLNFSTQVLFGCIFLSFTGICAITQVTAICNKYNISVKNYIVSKILSSLLTPILFVLIIKVIPDIYLVSLFSFKSKKVLLKVCLIIVIAVTLIISAITVIKKNKYAKYIKN